MWSFPILLLLPQRVTGTNTTWAYDYSQRWIKTARGVLRPVLRSGPVWMGRTTCTAHPSWRQLNAGLRAWCFFSSKKAQINLEAGSFCLSRTQPPERTWFSKERELFMSQLKTTISISFERSTGRGLMSMPVTQPVSLPLCRRVPEMGQRHPPSEN